MSQAAAARSESEAELIARAQTAVSQCNWEVGECAALWTKRFARGRTDADFAQLVGLSADQVYQRRRVSETYGEVYKSYPALKWSHFYAALNWDDAAECLQWAQDIGATVAEMKAWRRAQRGEDLTEVGDDASLNWLPSEPSEVRLPGAMLRGEGGATVAAAGERAASPSDAAPALSGVARAAEPGEYAPFRPDALTVPTEKKSPEREPPSVEQLVRRLTSTLERCAAAIDAAFIKQFADLPEKDRKRFLKSVQLLTEKVESLG